MLLKLSGKGKQPQSAQLLEIANCHKKNGCINDAIMMYAFHLLSNPNNSSIWLEKVKLEEEYGQFKQCSIDLRAVH